MNKKKFLVLGSTGMVGHVIALYLNENGNDVTAFSRKSFPYCKNITGDACDRKSFSSILKKGNYDVVINCIGVLKEACDENPARAIYLNSYLPHFIKDTLKDTKGKLIHLSTDCVFSGNKGCYSENSNFDGITLYERTKALGEIIDKKNLTFRTSVIGPDIHTNGIGLFNLFMQEKYCIKGYTKAIWTGVTSLTLAKAMERAVSENLTGLYHLVNNEVISKYDLLRLLNTHLRNDQIRIYQDELVNINRSLLNNRTDFNFIVPGYERMIIELKAWLTRYKYIYSHYN